jgi:hypothetical protein
MSFPPPPKNQQRPLLDLPQDQKDKIFAWGVLAFGAWLFYKNFRSEAAQKYIEGDPLYEEARRVLKTDAPHDDSIDIQSRRLDRIAKSFDPQVIERGVRLEMENTGGDELVARRAVVENLTRDPDHYDPPYLPERKVV